MPGIRALSPALQAIAEKELHEEPQRRDADITYIRDWLNKQPHIKANNPDDQTLLAFLRGCKFSLERTKEKLDMYYTMRTAVPEFFKNRSVKENKKLREILKLGLYLPLPQVDDQGRRIFIIRPGAIDPNKHKIDEQFKLNFSYTDWAIREDDELLINGIVTLIDLENVTLAHGSQMTPSVIKKLMVCGQDGFPIRPKGIHYVNTPPMFDTIFNLFKSFAKEKMKKRFFVHGSDLESLYTSIPKRLLPSEYGGDAGPIQDIIDSFVKNLDDYDKFFIEDSKCGVDESKRPGKPKTYQELFGLEGSFRQLAVD